MKPRHFTLICRRLPQSIAAITLFPFIVYREVSYTQDPVLVHHERIHLQQQLELLILPFYLWYGIEFLVRWIQLGNKRQAYRRISFEREAYAQEHHLNYSHKRRLFSFLKYL